MVSKQVEWRNQNSWGDVAKGLVALLAIVIIAVIAAAWLINLVGPGISAFFSSLSTLDTGVIVALVTGTVSIVTFVAGGIVNSCMKSREYLRLHREEPYMQLIAMFYDFQAQTKLNKAISQEELYGVFNHFTKELTLWGSSKAIQLWGNWRVSSSRATSDPEELLFGMEQVLMQLRKDMGLKRGIRKGDLLRLIVNDIDNYLGGTSSGSGTNKLSNS